VSRAGEHVGERRALRSRRLAPAAIALVLGAGVLVVLLVANPLASPSKPGGVSDNAAPTSLATVTHRELSSQTQVSATLGYGGSSSIRVPGGTPPSAVAQAEQSLTAAAGMLQTARVAFAADGDMLGEAQAIATAAREKESVDCAGDSAAEGAGLCASDAQVVASDVQGSSTAETKLAGDRASIVAAERALASAEAALSAARSSAAVYGQGSTFTGLPAVGQVIARGQSLYQIDGQPVLLLYGSVVPSRAFLAGMSPGRDVAALNANLDALGYGSGLAGDTFSAATEAAVRALQTAHTLGGAGGLSVTGALALGSVVFEPGPVRVTSVTPALGASVAPGPVLTVTSTIPQVTIALQASEQSSVKVGDPVTITLPGNATTPGVVSSVGSVAKAPSTKGGEGGGGGGGGENGEEGGATIEVDVALRDPSASGHLDEAPVSVSITTASVQGALAVPVDALLALAGGGYAVEVIEGRVHRLEAVTLGLFDDAEGVVQVSGSGVASGQRVVVPAS
jgi:fructose-specific component phosphotransferase system IIB-like protein